MVICFIQRVESWCFCYVLDLIYAIVLSYVHCVYVFVLHVE